ncbi:aminotransferase-like domain-containing protein [Zhihengliuella salsuginis]|uniref:GntR family transcriptional regulator n=1 Tax=Zhihengliuella salsuginis TaxID=578222 RepID=A0ABQ3GFY2_9MICC|nr:PLP-dependent aminotransferase family protein [Zhihengliuella salsuginis]GHD04873.1 GntR family transcriptional regulator [Zhihengliuella salsuginis]
MSHPFLSDAAVGFLPSPVRDVWELSMQPGMVSLAGGNPDLRLSDTGWMAEAAARAITDQGDEVLQYGSGTGFAALREAVVEVMSAEGVSASTDSIQVTAGSQLALDLITKLLFARGDTILAEGPTYVGALGVFGGAGVRVEHVEMDDDGLQPDALRETIDRLAGQGRRPRALYTIPNFHNPTGVSLAAGRRAEIVDICRAAGIPIIEDNPYGLLSFGEYDVPSLHSLDPELVIYLGSFSKILAPGLRVGWACAPTWLRRPLQLASESAVICASVLSQELARSFVAGGRWRDTVSAAAAEYARRAEALNGTLRPLLPAGAELTTPAGGFFSWLTLPEGWSSAGLLDHAVDEQVVFVPGASFYADDDGERQFRLAYSLENPLRLDEGARRLGRALASYGSALNVART